MWKLCISRLNGPAFRPSITSISIFLAKRFHMACSDVKIFPSLLRYIQKMITDLVDPNMGRPRSYKFVMRSGLPWCKMLKRAFVVVWDWGMFTRNGRWAMGKIYLLYGWVLTQCMTGCHLLHFNQRCRYGHCGPWQIALYLKSKHFVICEKLLFTLLCIKI